MLKRDDLRPGMRVRSLTDFAHGFRVGVIRSEPLDPQKILVPAKGGLDMIPVLIKTKSGESTLWWPLESLELKKRG